MAQGCQPGAVRAAACLPRLSEERRVEGLGALESPKLRLVVCTAACSSARPMRLYYNIQHTRNNSAVVTKAVEPPGALAIAWCTAAGARGEERDAPLRQSRTIGVAVTPLGLAETADSRVSCQSAGASSRPIFASKSRPQSPPSATICGRTWRRTRPRGCSMHGSKQRACALVRSVDRNAACVTLMARVVNTRASVLRRRSFHSNAVSVHGREEAYSGTGASMLSRGSLPSSVVRPASSATSSQTSLKQDSAAVGT